MLGARKVHLAATPKQVRGVIASAPVAVGRGDLAAIERLLLVGKSQAARLAAQRLLTRGSARAALQTLIAESWVRERRYQRACTAYLAAHAAEPTSSLGATALYTAGALGSNSSSVRTWQSGVSRATLISTGRVASAKALCTCSSVRFARVGPLPRPLA